MKNIFSKYISFFVLILTFISCENRESNSLLNDKATEIKIDLSNSDILPISELFSKIEYVKLNSPDNQIIGPFVKKVIQNDKIALFDNQNSSIWVFNTDGEFINRIEIKAGNGPGEMMHLNDITFADDGTIHALGAMKVLKFDLTGKLLNEFIINAAIYQFAYLSPAGIYAGFANNSFNLGFENISGDNIILFDEDGEVIDSYLPIDERFDGLIYSTFNNFPRYDNKQLLFIHLVDKIFEITTNGYKIKYRLNFGKNSIPDEIFDRRSRYPRPLDFFRNEVVDKDFVAYIVQVGENNNNLILTLRSNHQNYTVIFNKKTNESAVYSNLVNDIDFGPFPNLYTVHNNKVYARIEATDIINFAERIQENDKEISPEIARFLKLSESLTINSNPLLLIGTFH